MHLLFEGLPALFQNLIVVAVFFMTSTGLGICWICFVPSTRSMSDGRKLVIAAAVGTIPLTLFSYIFLQIAIIWSPAFVIGSRLLALVGTVVFILFLRKIWWRQNSRKEWIITGAAILAFVIFLSLRLSFLHNLVLPPYHDSVSHYKVLMWFLDPQTTPSFFTANYYHYGFHCTAAWLVEVAGVAPVDSLALLGQLFLSLVPLSLFVFVHTLTGDWKPALLTALIGAFSWSMPAHAANWGKYPALAAIIVFPAILALLVIQFQSPGHKFKGFYLALTAMLSLAGITFLHSRGFVLLILAVLFLMIDKLLLHRLSILFQRILAAILAAGFLTVMYFSSSLLQLFATPLLPFIFFILALIACIFWNPRLSIGATLWGISVCAFTLIPAPGYFARFSYSVIDTPFIQIAAFLPITLLTGAGIYECIERSKIKKWLHWFVIATVVCFLFFGVFTQAYKPDDCCNYASADDLAVINWIADNLPPDAQIAIPGRYDLYPIVGSDSGIWIYELTSRKTFMLAYDYTWFEQSAHDDICDMGVIYIFSSTSPLSFQINPITHSDWYQPVIITGEDVIYRVIGCTGN